MAIHDALAALIDPGDEVLVPAPYWTTYPESIKLVRGVPIVVTAAPEFKVTVEQPEAASPLSVSSRRSPTW